MRPVLLVLLLTLPLACEPREEAEEEPAAEDTTAAEPSPAPGGAQIAEGTVGTDAFDLQMPGGKACIHIPEGAAPQGTVVTITKITPPPKEFAENGRIVYSHAFDFDAVPSFTVEVDSLRPTIGICSSPTHDHPHPAGLRVAHLDPVTLTVAVLDSVAPCALQCGGSQPPAASSAWFDGTPLSPTPLYAGSAAMFGLGGKSAGLSPFAIVTPEGQAP